MKYAITKECVSCHACRLVCPRHAVDYNPEQGRFQIHTHRCDGCETLQISPQCATICPIEEAIVDQHAVPVNPKGSLTGIATQEAR